MRAGPGGLGQTSCAGVRIGRYVRDVREPSLARADGGTWGGGEADDRGGGKCACSNAGLEAWCGAPPPVEHRHSCYSQRVAASLALLHTIFPQCGTALQNTGACLGLGALTWACSEEQHVWEESWHWFFIAQQTHPPFASVKGAGGTRLKKLRHKRQWVWPPPIAATGGCGICYSSRTDGKDCWKPSAM